MLYPFTCRTSRPKTSCCCWSLNHLHIWQIQVWLYESDMVYVSPRLPAIDGHADHNRCGLGLYVTIRADAACTSVTATLPGERWVWNINPCLAEFILRNIYIWIYYHIWTLRWCRLLKSFLLEDKDPFAVYSQYYDWPVMISWHEEPRHQQPWYWPSYLETFWFQYQKS